MKKIFIPIIVLSFLLIGVLTFYFINSKSKIASVLTIDINPSIRINLDQDDKVISVIALNDEANEIINNDLEGKNLQDTLKFITNNVIEKGYAKEEVTILISAKGNINQEEIQNNIIINFEEKHIRAEVISVENITKEDEEMAKEYNVSPAKMAYINSISKDNNEIDAEDLVNKPISELKETKDTGFYCADGYILEGSFCLKELERNKANTGSVCPVNYYEYKGKCYEEIGVIDTDNLICRDEFTLEGNECVRRITTKAEVVSYTCSKGMVRTKAEVGEAVNGSGDANNPVCVDSESITRPVTPCDLPKSDPTERMSSGGKCYWHRAPVIPEGCPGKIKVNGECWDDASNVYLCPNGNNSNIRSKDDYCYTALKDVKPVADGYKCEDNMTLDGNKCIKEEREEAMHERVCPDGYSLVNNDRCINYNKKVNKENGLVCTGDNVRLKGNDCVTYEIVEAKHN